MAGAGVDRSSREARWRMRESGLAVRVVILELDRDDYQDVYVELHPAVGVVEIFTPAQGGGAGDLVATAPLSKTLIEWSENHLAKYPPQD